MEELLDLLSDLIPTVIILSGFLLPAFLRKKKKADKGPVRAPGTGPPAEKKPTGRDMEEKVRRYFQEMVKGKEPGAAAKKKTAEPKPPPPPQPAAKPQPRAEVASALEQLEPSQFQKKGEMATAEPFSSLEDRGGAKFPAAKGDAYTLDRAAYEITHGDAYTVDVDAYDVDVDAYGAGGTEALPSGARLLERKKREKIPHLESRIGRRRKKAAPSAPLRPVAFLSGGLTSRELREAIILKEVLDRPVGIRGFADELLW